MVLVFLGGNYASAEKPMGKLLEFGWDQPEVLFVHTHLTEVELLPFDGIILSPGKRDAKPGQERQLGLAWTFWQSEPLTGEQKNRFQDDIDLLAKTKFKRMDQNFLQVNSHPGGLNLDWFDDKAYANILDNWRLIAKGVRKSRARGIFFDNEYYAKRKGPGWRPCVWQYDVQPQRNKHSFEEYQKQVQVKARQIMKIIRQECPGAAILLPFGDSLLFGQTKETLKTHRYGLFPAFLDGWLAEAGDNVTIIDGYENAYGFREEKQFAEAQNLVLQKSAVMSRHPDLYRKHIKMGFGLFIDHIQKMTWHIESSEFTKNYYTPDELAYAVHGGLKHGTYTWIYTQKINWWTGEFRPAAYVQALTRAKQLSGVANPPARKAESDKERPLD
jgi:hypothetical protein